MKIVYIVKVFPKLSETFVIDQITYLIDLGHQVNILAEKNSGEYLESAHFERYNLGSKTTYFTKCKSAPGFELTEELIEIISEADVLHAHFANSPAQHAKALSEIAGTPYVITAHAYDIFIQPDVVQLKKLFKGAFRVLTISEYNRQYLIELVGNCIAEKIEIIHCGVDLEKFMSVTKQPEQTLRVLVCGRLVEKKGIEYAIRAMSSLRKDYNLKLNIIGTGLLQVRLEKLVAQLKLESVVEFLGDISHDEVARHMRDSDLFVLPCVTAADGDREGIPVVLLEAQASETPVISTLHSGIPEGVINENTGLLIPERDVDQLAGAMSRLLANPKLRKEMGIRGRSHIEERFNRKTEFEKLLKVLHLAADQKLLLLKKAGTMTHLELARYEQLESEASFLKSDRANIEFQLETAKQLNQDFQQHSATLINEINWYRHHITWRMLQPLRAVVSRMKTSEVLSRFFLSERKRTYPASSTRLVNDKGMKILYVLDRFPKLSETFILNEVVELLNRGIIIHIVALHNPFEDIVNQKVLTHGLMAKTYWLDEGHRKIFLRSDTVKALFRDVDIVHSHFATAAAEVALRIATILKKPMTVTTHAYELFENPDTPKLKHLFEQARLVFTPSLYNKDYIVQLVGCDPRKIRIVRAGIDTKQIAPKRTSDNDPKRNELMIISIGRLVEKKGLSYLLDAMQTVVKEVPNTTLYIVGDGLMRTHLEAQTKSLGIEANVQFFGNQSNERCLELIDLSDIMVLPCIISESGDRDVCPLVLQEAMALAVPVISTEIASITELVENGISGILVPQRDSKSLADAILKLANSPDSRLKMGNRARVLVEKEFDISVQVNRLTKHWNDLLNENLPKPDAS